jgi:CO/xanthine dehydrogenase Mo-binding subunit
MNVSLAANPHLVDWIAVDPDEDRLRVFTGKVELGQQIHHALRLVVAGELELPPSCIDVLPVSTGDSPEEGLTAGSLSVAQSGGALAAAAVTLRRLAAKAAAERIGSADLKLSSGRFLGREGGEGVCFFECARLVSGSAEVEALPPDHRWARQFEDASNDAYRAAASGQLRFIQDLKPAGLLHARALRNGNPLVEADLETIGAIRGIKHVVRDGGFIAIVCDSDAALSQGATAAERAIKRKNIRSGDHDGPVENWIKSSSRLTNFAHRSTRAPSSNELQVQISVSRPFLLHASIAPSCGLARYRDGRLEVWTHSQGIFALRDVLAARLGLSQDMVIVHHVRSAGCYGHNAADDAAADAALVAFNLPGETIRVAWTRQDDLTQAPVGAPMQVEIDAALDSEMRIGRWDYRIWSGSHGQRPGGNGNTNLLALIERDPALGTAEIKDVHPAAGGGAERNALSPYDVPAHSVEVSILQALPVRSSALRSLGAQMNVAAIEGAMDDLAALAGKDPIAFRLRNLQDPRGRGVIERLRDEWLVEAAQQLAENEAIGIGYSRYKDKCAYAAVAVRVRIDEEPEVVAIHTVVDAGKVIDEVGTRAQIEGGALQAVSWTLVEGACLRDGRLDLESLEDYPILAWHNIPGITVDLVSPAGEDQPPLGVGECMQGPVTAAILNAVSHLVGMRVGQLPVNRERLISLLS